MVADPAHERQALALALELERRVAVHVGVVAHLGRVPQRAALVDALEPRHAVEPLRHEDDDVLGPALALRRRAERVVGARPAQHRQRQRPAIAHARDVTGQLTLVEGLGHRHQSILTHSDAPSQRLNQMRTRRSRAVRRTRPRACRGRRCGPPRRRRRRWPRRAGRWRRRGRCPRRRRSAGWPRSGRPRSCSRRPGRADRRRRRAPARPPPAWGPSAASSPTISRMRVKASAHLLDSRPAPSCSTGTSA